MNEEFEEEGKTSATCKGFVKCELMAAFHTVKVLLLQRQPCKSLSTHVPRLLFFLSFSPCLFKTCLTSLGSVFPLPILPQ